MNRFFRILLITMLCWPVSPGNATQTALPPDFLGNVEIPVVGTPSPSDRLARGACLGRTDLVKAALAEKARPDDPVSIYDTEGGALFLNAACPNRIAQEDEKRLEIARLLLEAGADIHKPGVIRFRGAAVPMAPHLAAAYTNRPRLLEFLLQHGARADEGDYARDGAALLWAAERGCVACVPVLLRNGADIERRNNMALTALYVAAARGDPAMLTVLLENGANPFVKESAGVSILDAATGDSVRELLQTARRRKVATLAAWSVTAVFVVAAGIFLVLRRESAEGEPVA